MALSANNWPLIALAISRRLSADGHTDIQCAVTTRPLGVQVQPDLSAGDPRNVLAQWLTAADNPWFCPHVC